jgi:hypothetical protein
VKLVHCKVEEGRAGVWRGKGFVYHDRLRLRVGGGVNSDMSGLDWPAPAGTIRHVYLVRWGKVGIIMTDAADSNFPYRSNPYNHYSLFFFLIISFPAVDPDLLFIAARNYVCIFIPQFQPVALYHSVRPLVSSATS